MPGSPNKLSQFWLELKRRKVLRVITVYAAVAFIILQLVEILAPSLRLPEWTMNFILVILIVGFIIAVIVSWIYDIHPEEGIVKSEPAHKVKEEDAAQSSNSWKIASYISFVVIVALIVLNIIPRANNKMAILEKSIAVLPFINDSPDEENTYFINGIMDEILLNLQAIKDFQVPGRTSVEKYRNQSKSIPEIASELGVNYIVEASGQKYGNTFVLRVQLLDGQTGMHLWGESIEQDIESVDVITSIQSGIAESIAAELEAVITPEEKQLIEKIPTKDLTAHDFYQRGKEEWWNYWSDNDNIEALGRAEELYHKALEYDSTFALAYTGLARVFLEKHYWKTYFSEYFLDSVLILADIAISHDEEIAEAYTVRGDCYREIGQTEQAIKEYDKAIELNSNNWLAYASKGKMYWDIDFAKAIENFHNAASLNRGSELPFLLGALFNRYYMAGFREEGLDYLHEKLKLDGDSVNYYVYLSWDAYYHNDFEKGIEYGKKALGIDTSFFNALKILGLNYSGLGQHEQSLKYFRKSIERRDSLGALQINYMQRLGYEYWQNGSKEEADYYFDKQIDYSNKANELGRNYSNVLDSYYDLAGVYAFRGKKDEAYENLRIFSQVRMIRFGLLCLFKRDPLFESIRNEPEFQQILNDVEAKYQAEHERVRKWLEENDML